MNRNTRRSPVTVRRDTIAPRDNRDSRDTRDSKIASVPVRQTKQRVERDESQDDYEIKDKPVRPQSAKPIQQSRKVEKIVDEHYSDEEETRPLPSLKSSEIHEEETHNNESDEDYPSQTTSSSSSSSKSKPVKNTRADRKQKSDDNFEEDEEHLEKDDGHVGGGRRQQSLLPKAIVAKLIAESGIEGVSADVYPYVIQEIQDFLRHVIKSLREEADGDELVIKESYLKFLGDKSRAPGVLDMKSFEKIYTATSYDFDINPEFSSSAFSSLCKYSEIHVVDFLRKARKIVNFYGRKRLTSKDLDLLKEMLE
jgi:histone H3/H4